jgi:hypothetical protein
MFGIKQKYLYWFLAALILIAAGTYALNLLQTREGASNSRPGGDYNKSCKNVKWSGGFLSGICDDGRGGWTSTGMFARSGDYIKNCKGNLKKATWAGNCP